MSNMQKLLFSSDVKMEHNLSLTMYVSAVTGQHSKQEHRLKHAPHLPIVYKRQNL